MIRVKVVEERTNAVTEYTAHTVGLRGPWLVLMLAPNKEVFIPQHRMQYVTVIYPNEGAQA